MLTVLNNHMGEPPRIYEAAEVGACRGGPARSLAANQAAAFALTARSSTAPPANERARLVIGIYNLFEGWRYKWKQMCVFYG